MAKVKHKLLDLTTGGTSKMFPHLPRIKYSSSTFPGGEVNLRILEDMEHCSTVTIITQLTDSNKVMELVFAKDALDRLDVKSVHLWMGYIPYARQDRVCNSGESLGIKVFAGIINECKFEQVVLVEPHSDVTPALFDNVKVWSTEPYLRQAVEDMMDPPKNLVYVAPDAGAVKRVENYAKIHKQMGLPVIGVAYGVKHREVSTGKLTGFGFNISPEFDVQNPHLLIVDDICDGGGTFKGLSEIIQKDYPKDFINLFVTHGIFSQGTKDFDRYFNRVFSTDSFRSDLEGIEVINL